MSRVMLTKPAQYIVTAMFMVYMAASIYGMTQYDMDAIHIDTVSNNSYLQNWERYHRTNFNGEVTIQFITLHPNGFLEDRAIVKKYVDVIKSKSFLQENSLHFWYDVYKNMSNENVSSDAQLIKSARNSLFFDNPIYENDIVFDNQSALITASKFYVRTKDLQTTKEIIEIQEDLEETIEALEDIYNYRWGHADDGTFDLLKWREVDTDQFVVYSPVFYFTDSYTFPLIEILKITTTQCVVLTMGCLFTDRNVYLAIHVPLGYLSMVGGLVGMSHFLGVYLTQIPMVFYMMGTWYFIDVIVHNFHCYIKTEGTDKGARINVMMNTVSHILFLTHFGHFIGILILVFVHSYVFISVFKIFVLAITISIVHTICFHPCFLSWVGLGNGNLPTVSIKSFRSSEGKINTVFQSDNTVYM